MKPPVIHAVVILAIAGCVLAQSPPAERPRVAIIDFTEKGQVGIPEAGKTVAELLLTKFGPDRFQLVERSQLTALLKEMDLTIALVQENPEKVYGKLKGVKYLVLGSVNKLGNITITSRLTNVATGDIVQTAEVSAEDARGLQNALGELAAILQMTEAEKKAYLDDKQYPQLLSDARAKAAAKDYDAAIALYQRALAVRATSEARDELKAVQDAKSRLEKLQAEQKESEQRFSQLMSQAQKIVDALPADKGNLSEPQRADVAAALKAAQDALALRPSDAGAAAMVRTVRSYLPLEKELVLDLGDGASMRLVLIPAGKFMMGSPETEAHRDTTEGPRHEVTISRPFYMGVYHVTKAQFASFVSDSGYRTEAERIGDAMSWDGDGFFVVTKGASWRNTGLERTAAEHPVVYVSHNDARAFCNWLGKKTGKYIALPTEAQWEYACRAGTTTAYQWGDNPDGGRGWCNAADQTARKTLPSRWEYFGWDDGYTFTSPVGKFKPNAFGLYDMHGNVWQWCADWYDARYYDIAKKADPQGPDSGADHVMRGGSWLCDPWQCRSAYRQKGTPDDRDGRIGFRVVALPE